MNCGVVVIGRNEGKRLSTCLQSVIDLRWRAVYVDSGSTDGSISMAHRWGAQVVELDLAIPFSAARARNVGWRTLLAEHPDLEMVQFVDGDCELLPGWLDSAADFLATHPTAAVVFGRSRERFRDATVYNRLCDIEWIVPPGLASACGGNSMMRVKALVQTGGFDDGLIAGEEPELCFRLRAQGWDIHCLAADMTLHDAAMTSWRQWWRRMKRSGYAYANGHFLHGAPPARWCRKEVRSILIWGALIPGLALLGALLHLAVLLLLLAYPVQWLRIWRRCLAAGLLQREDCNLYATHCVLGQFPGLLGFLSFHYHRLRGEQRRLIEYK